MRKKSHISLAKYIVGRVEEQGLVKHKKAFYLGSILPDCKPSFFTEKQEMEGTFPKLQEELRELVEGQQLGPFQAQAPQQPGEAPGILRAVVVPGYHRDAGQNVLPGVQGGPQVLQDGAVFLARALAVPFGFPVLYVE